MLLGFMSGPMMEEYLRRALLLSRSDPVVFIERPIDATMLGPAVAVMVVWPADWAEIGSLSRTAGGAAMSSARTPCRNGRPAESATRTPAAHTGVHAPPAKLRWSLLNESGAARAHPCRIYR